MPDNGRIDCTLELEKADDFGNLRMADMQFGQGSTSLLSLRQMVKAGRPAVVIVMPPGLAFEASSQETFLENLKRLSEMRPIIIVSGGK